MTPDVQLTTRRLLRRRWRDDDREAFHERCFDEHGFGLRCVERDGEVLGFNPDADLDHPGVPHDRPLVPHVLYRISRMQYRDAQYGAAL